MMKRISVMLVLGILIMSIQVVHAEDYWSLYKKDPDAFYKKMMCIDEESIEKGYYSDARKSENSKTNIVNNYVKGTSKSDELNKGYVFGDDELHVVGTPSDSRGYTKAGDYTNMKSKGKGWVYAADELHVVGLPTDPETGYTLPGYYGEIGE